MDSSHYLRLAIGTKLLLATPLLHTLKMKEMFAIKSDALLLIFKLIPANSASNYQMNYSS